MVVMVSGLVPNVAAEGRAILRCPSCGVCSEALFEAENQGLSGLEPHSLDRVMILVPSVPVACDLGVRPLSFRGTRRAGEGSCDHRLYIWPWRS